MTRCGDSFGGTTGSGLSSSGLARGQLPGEVPGDAASPAVHPADGFFNRRWVQNLLPLATSLLFHLTLIVIGFAVFKTVQAIQIPANKRQAIVPDTRIIDRARPLLPAAAPSTANPLHSEFDLARIGNESGSDDLPGRTGINPAESGSEFLGKRLTSDGGGFGPTGDRHPYGNPGGTPDGTAPGGGLINQPPGGNADRVVYLVDCSGSMIGVFGDVKSELKKSVMSLRADSYSCQQFNVIFFSDGTPQVLFKDGVQVATAANKKKAAEFIDDAVASGGTIPLPAIKAAFTGSPKPDLVWVLTDGFDNVSSFDDVVNTFQKETADGQTHVNCFFFQSDPDPKLVEVLTKIAENGHGRLTTVMKADMQ